MESTRTMINLKRLTFLLAVLAPGAVQPLHAQLDLGTWVRQENSTMTGSMTMTVEACCNRGRRLTYHIVIGNTTSLLTVESQLDGTEAPVMMNGKPSGETMAIKRLDDHHASAVVKMNGRPFGTSQSTLSPDGRTLTVLNDFSSSVGGQEAGKSTEVWVRE